MVKKFGTRKFMKTLPVKPKNFKQKSLIIWNYKQISNVKQKNFELKQKISDIDQIFLSLCFIFIYNRIRLPF